MEEELQSKLVEILTSIQTAAGKASDFALEQLPDIAQSYVAYGRAWATFTVVVFLAGFVASLWAAIRHGYANTKAVENGGWRAGAWKDHRVAAAFFGTTASLVLFIFLMSAAQSLALVWLAPKVWLLKEIARLVR
jgi:hypothetical protein